MVACGEAGKRPIQATALAGSLAVCCGGTGIYCRFK